MVSMLTEIYQNDFGHFNYNWCTFSHCKFDAAVFANIHTLLQEKLAIETSRAIMVSDFPSNAWADPVFLPHHLLKKVAQQALPVNFL